MNICNNRLVTAAEILYNEKTNAQIYFYKEEHREMKKRILSVLTALALVLTWLPSAAIAAEGSHVSTRAKAVSTDKMRFFISRCSSL